MAFMTTVMSSQYLMTKACAWHGLNQSNGVNDCSSWFICKPIDEDLVLEMENFIIPTAVVIFAGIIALNKGI